MAYQIVSKLMKYPEYHYYKISNRTYVPKETFDYYIDIIEHNQEVFMKRISYLEHTKLSAETRHTAEIKNLRKQIESLKKETQSLSENGLTPSE